jgi:hypothetical protein
MNKLLVLRNLTQTVSNMPNYRNKSYYFSKWQRGHLKKNFLRGFRLYRIINRLEIKRLEQNFPKDLLMRTFLRILFKKADQNKTSAILLSKKKVDNY